MKREQRSIYKNREREDGRHGGEYRTQTVRERGSEREGTREIRRRESQKQGKGCLVEILDTERKRRQGMGWVGNHSQRKTKRED